MFFRGVAIGVAAISLGCFWVATLVLNGRGPAPSLVFTGLGAMLILIAGLGPLRIGMSSIQIPFEVKRTMLTVGFSLPAAGLGFIALGLVSARFAVTGAWVLIGLSAAVAAYVGFHRLSGTLPHTFMMDEMVRIMKSAGLLSGSESVVDREFKRWSKGVREGVAVDAKAPDVPLLSMDGQPRQLSEFFDGRTLVLNLGSYTCPHHRKRIDELHGLFERWSGRGVEFLTVYTAEAHPEDGWSLKDQYNNDEEYQGNPSDFCFYHAKTLEDRRQMAQWMLNKKKFRWPMALDPMDDPALQAYNSWPIRLYVIHENKVVYSGAQGPFGYAPLEVEETLKRLKENTT